MSKNGDPRALRLRDDLRDMLSAHRGDKTAGKVFRFARGGGIKDKLVKAKLIDCGVPLPRRRRKQPKEERRIPPHRLRWVTFHTFPTHMGHMVSPLRRRRPARPGRDRQLARCPLGRALCPCRAAR